MLSCHHATQCIKIWCRSIDQISSWMVPGCRCGIPESVNFMDLGIQSPHTVTRLLQLLWKFQSLQALQRYFCWCNFVASQQTTLLHNIKFQYAIDFGVVTLLWPSWNMVQFHTIFHHYQVFGFCRQKLVSAKHPWKILNRPTSTVVLSHDNRISCL